MILKLIILFFVSAIELWIAIPMGMGMHIPLTLVGISSASGAIVGILTATYAGNKVRLLILRWANFRKDTKIRNFLLRNGAVAIGLLGPILLGVTLTAAIASTLNLKRSVWMSLLTAGTLFWTFLLIFGGHIFLAR